MSQESNIELLKSMGMFEKTKHPHATLAGFIGDRYLAFYLKEVPETIEKLIVFIGEEMVEDYKSYADPIDD